MLSTAWQQLNIDANKCKGGLASYKEFCGSDDYLIALQYMHILSEKYRPKINTAVLTHSQKMDVLVQDFLSGHQTKGTLASRSTHHEDTRCSLCCGDEGPDPCLNNASPNHSIMATLYRNSFQMPSSAKSLGVQTCKVISTI